MFCPSMLGLQAGGTTLRVYMDTGDPNSLSPLPVVTVATVVSISLSVCLSLFETGSYSTVLADLEMVLAPILLPQLAVLLEVLGLCATVPRFI